MTYLLAQDIGTSSAKATLFTSDGVLVRSCSTFYEVQRPAPNWAQQNAEVWWDAFCENNHKLLTDWIFPALLPYPSADK